MPDANTDKLVHQTGFRQWLDQRKWQGEPLTAKAKENRIRRSGRAERGLSGLGFDQTTLAAVHASGQWDALLNRLTELKNNPLSDMEAVRAVVPQAQEPSGQLSNMIAAVKQYGYYLDKRDPNYGAESDLADKAWPELTREAVIAAMDECDALGEAAFLQKYGFAAATDFDVLHPDKPQKYAPKAIFAAAIKTVADEELSPREFTTHQANAEFEKLGFEIVRRGSEAGQQQIPSQDVILDHFRGNAYFQQHEPDWNDEQRTAFCDFAMAVHHAGIDWYDTKIPQIRFGRKNQNDADAFAVLGSIHISKNRLQVLLPRDFGHSNNRKYFNFSNEDGAALYAEFDEAKGRFMAKIRPVERAGLWPDDYARPDPISQDDISLNVSPMPNPTNLILYGPPGTGKTFTTAYEAVLLCDGSAPSERTALMERYNALREAGRIGFVTFHQSYDYESFVEGLRPQAIEGGTGFTLEPTPGIFREIAQLALEAGRPAVDEISDTGASRQGLVIGKRQVFKMSLGESGTEEHIYEDALDTESISLGWGGGIDWTPFDSYEAIHARWNEDHPGTNGNDGNITQIYRFRVSMQKGDLVLVSSGNSAFRAIAEVTGDYTFDPQSEHPNRRAVRWLRVFDEPIAVDTVYNRKFSMRSCYRLRDEHLKREALQTLLAGVVDTAEPATGWTEERLTTLRKMWEEGATASQIATRLGGISRNVVIGKAHRLGLKARPAAQRPQAAVTTGEPPLSTDASTPGPLQFVLVIDEINRGNISKIFGELITLIEHDKRLGMKPNELTVRLPYSGKEFGVPANLHIIGTMNTADRSIALLDTALRRRFTFREMAPRHELLEPVAGIDLAGVLKTINERVEYLLDREHRIGHAFFMGCKDKTDVDGVMRDKVIPLLQEYFFEDFARVNAILGDGFIVGVELKAPPGFEAHGKAPKNWSVRTEFDVSAYHALSGKAFEGVANAANANI